MERRRLSIPKRGRLEWEEETNGTAPPCPLVQLSVPMEDKGSYPHLQRASRDGSDQRNCWTLEQLECLWAELDMLLTGVDERRAQLHGERAALTVWMALSMLKSPPALSQPLDDESERGPARTRSAANAGGVEGLGLTRQQSATLNGRGGGTARTTKPEADAPSGAKVEPVGVLAGGAKKAAQPDPPDEWEGEAAGYKIRRVSAEADPAALWNFTDAYFAPIPASAADVLDAEVRIRRFCVDDVDASVDPFEILPRGRHYLEQWEEEARLLASIMPNGAAAYSTPPLPPPALAAAGASGERLHWQLDADELTTFTPRVFNALVDQPGFVPRIDIAPTRAGAVDALSQPTPPAVMAVCAECDMREFSARLEAQLRLELVRVGLLDSTADVPGDEDDSLCAELRQAQAQLRAAVAHNEALCRESRLELDRWLDGQQVDEQRRAHADALVERWRVVMKRLKAERKAERKRKKLGNLKVGGRKAADPAAAAAAPCKDGEAAGAPAAADGGGAADDAEAPTKGADEEANGEGNSNDESSEEEREEEPGPGWGAAAPAGIATALASNGNAKAERPTTARKRAATRANPGSGAE